MAKLLQTNRVEKAAMLPADAARGNDSFLFAYAGRRRLTQGIE
ncbi:hypothetical protein [Ottowia beijingensis]|nr:hypothetical protein [Ottowia beijingensis]